VEIAVKLMSRASANAWASKIKVKFGKENNLGTVEMILKGP
jgi:hypothetical protein